MIKRLFGGSPDTVLSQIRKAFTNDVSKKPIEITTSIFPTEIINKNVKRDAGITDEFIDDILWTQKDDVYAFSILALLYPNLDYVNNNFHKEYNFKTNEIFKIYVAIDFKIIKSVNPYCYFLHKCFIFFETLQAKFFIISNFIRYYEKYKIVAIKNWIIMRFRV